jgi:hypothetical protein
MNRRQFFKWLGVGAAAAVVAPSAFATEPSACVAPVCNLSDYGTYPWVEHKPYQCSCAGRSFWEGECEWCHAHPAPRQPIENYADYTNFSSIISVSSIDDPVALAAKELGYRAGLSVQRLVSEC